MEYKNVVKEFLESRKKYLNDLKNEKNKVTRLKKRIPNILTASRLFTPVVVIPVTLLGSFKLGLISTIFFALTDTFDGYLARKWNVVSNYGKTLDTICDKMFALGLAIPILFTNPMLVIPAIILEGIIADICYTSSKKNNNAHSTLLGKTKTVLLFSSLVSIYLCKGFNIPIELAYGLMGISNIFQVASSIQYYDLDKKEDLQKVINFTKENSEVSKTEEKKTYQNIKNNLLTSNQNEKILVKTMKKL